MLKFLRALAQRFALAPTLALHAAVLACCLALPGSATAQTSGTTGFTLPTCIHRSTWTPYGTGTDWVRGSEAPVTETGVRVSWWAWWCPQTDGTWSPYIFRCVEGRTCLSAWQITSELDSAARSPDRLAALGAVITKYQTMPLDTEVEDLIFAGAAARVALDAIKPTEPLGVVYVVTGRQAFALKADGTRSTTPYPTAPTFGATCDCATKFMQYGALFCKVPDLSTAQTTVVAGCSLKR